MNRVSHAVAGLGRLSRNLAEHQYQGPGGNLKPISTADRDGSANEITPHTEINEMKECCWTNPGLKLNLSRLFGFSFLVFSLRRFFKCNPSKTSY